MTSGRRIDSMSSSSSSRSASRVVGPTTQRSPAWCSATSRPTIRCVRGREGLVERPFGAVLAGHLVGSIDVVARVERAGEPPRFVVVDYKTNTLTPRGLEPTIDDYHPDRLVGAMDEHDYPLQALLYSVALHRYLRWRIPTYDPALHLGGIAYLFVRGMIGTDTPTVDGRPYGVFSWTPPSALVEDLSDLLDGRSIDVGAVG